MLLCQREAFLAKRPGLDVVALVAGDGGQAQQPYDQEHPFLAMSPRDFQALSHTSLRCLHIALVPR